MAAALELFYFYAYKDEALRKKLEIHLSSLEREGLINQWYEQKINAGQTRAKEIDARLKKTHIFLLLVTSDFIASDYCYGIEMQEVIKRHVSGEARAIPIILRPCDWEAAIFGKIQALPKGGKPVTTWSNRDAAFTDIAKGIRNVIYELNRSLPVTPSQIITPQKRYNNTKTGKANGGRNMSVAFSNSAFKKPIVRYYEELNGYKGKADYELAVRTAFQNLLADSGRLVKWTLIPEQTMESGIRPDGVMHDDFKRKRGFWEAKGPNSDLDREVSKKISSGYPLTNTIFENTKRAVLFQNKRRKSEYDLRNPNEVGDLLKEFFTYTEPHIESFDMAVQEFKKRVPELAQALLAIIEREYKQNKKFINAFNSFTELCRTSLDPKISTDVINEMLIQHLLTERLFRTVFDNSDFINRNVIAVEVEKVIQALTSHAFNRHDFLKSLDRFYVAIEADAKSIDDWLERQHFLDTVYERFFQGYSVKRADTFGIVYTPREIVDFMGTSVDEILQREFGTSIAEPGVQIIDPCVGTGSFIINLLHRIPNYKLKYKYQNDLYCNEIMLLPYYIASMNIEHEYYRRMNEYEPFDGICFADTLELAQGQQLSMFVEENTARVKREKEAQITVVIGNPPYNVGQKSENDNNKNRRYQVIDEHVYDLYVKGSKATNTRALSDPYVKFFRWATDRLQGRNGIVCLVSNNSFLESCAFDGFRKRLAEEFTSIYHIDLSGNARKQSGGNVFGVMVGIGITLLVRNRKDSQPSDQSASIYYHKVMVNQSGTAKLSFLATKASINGIDWQELHPDKNHIWLTENLRPEFETSSFLSMGAKEAKAARSVEFGGIEVNTIFKTYSPGIQTNRDSWMYDFDASKLAIKASSMIETYNAELARWIRAGSPKKDIDNFVLADETKIKWCSRLKECLARKMEANFKEETIRHALFRPFTRKFLYFDNMMTHRQGMFPMIFPTPSSENENIVIWLKVGSEWPMFALATNILPDLLPQGASQCFPYYTYSEDGSNRRENITDWALKQFRSRYGSEITKRDIFHYVYTMLHHPKYYELYEENLKCELPRIPLLHRKETFLRCVEIGRQLMDMHLYYESEKEYPLNWLVNNDVPFSWRVDKAMKLTPDKTTVIVNDSLQLAGIPKECFQYKLGNRSALDWVIDQYQITKDKHSGIVSDPNNLDDEEHIVHLIGKVVTVSVETIGLINELMQLVLQEDWMGESTEKS